MEIIKLTLELNGKTVTTQMSENLYERLKTQFSTNPLYDMVDVLESELNWETLRNQGLDAPLNDDILCEQTPKNKTKLNNRFICSFPPFNIPSYSIRSISRPAYCTTDGWLPIRIDFYDIIEPSITKILMKIIKSYEMYGPDEFEIKIETLEPTGKTIETFIIFVEEFISINFPSWSYDKGNEKSNPYIVVKPSKCFIK